MSGWTHRNPLAMGRSELPLQAPPDWLLAAASQPHAQPRKSDAQRPAVDRMLDAAVEKVKADSGRNDSGMFLFCQMRDNGYSRDEAVLVLREWVAKANEAAPGERSTLGETQATLRSVHARDAREPWTQPGKRNNVAKQLEDLSSDIELLHSPKGDAFAVVPANNHVECWAVDSKTFKGILTSRYFKAHNATPGRDALQSFIDLTGRKYQLMRQCGWTRESGCSHILCPG